MRARCYLGVFLLLCSFIGYAQLTVVQDTGATVQASPHLVQRNIPTPNTLKMQIQKKRAQIQKASIAKKKLLYPNHSDLTPGEIKKHCLEAVHFPNYPLFIIGTDQRSFSWVKQNATYLKKIHAFGIVINVEKPSAVQKIENQTGLLLTPVQIKGLDSLLGIHHYPVLVYHGWVWQ
mgnify:CR=1 FL=1